MPFSCVWAGQHLVPMSFSSWLIWLLSAAVPILSGEMKSHQIIRIATEQGLSHPSVYGIVQDHKGFIWFGTQNGLNQYDGKQITPYQHLQSNPNSLSHNSISCLLMGPDSRIWIGTWGGGLNRFDPSLGNFDHFIHDATDPTSLSNNIIQCLYMDSNHVLWVGTFNDGLNRLNSGDRTFTRFVHHAEQRDSLSHDRIWSITEDGMGRLWVATGEGLNRYAGAGRFVHYRHDPARPSLSHDKVRVLFKDSHDYLWIGTEEGLNLFDPRSERFLEYLENPNDSIHLKDKIITAITEDRAGNLWVGTIFNGLHRFSRGSSHRGRFSRFIHDPLDVNSLSQNDIRAIYEDRSRVLWITTRAGGINKMDLKPRKFEVYQVRTTSPTDLFDNRVNALVEDVRGDLWIGAVGGLLQLDRDNRAYRFYRHDPLDPSSLSDSRIYSLLLDRAGFLWVGTFDGGLNRFDRETGSVLRLQHNPADPESLSHNFVRAIYEDHQARLWVTTEGGGLNLLDRDTGTFRHYRHKPKDYTSLGDDRVMSILEDRRGALWLGTFEAGLCRFEPEQGRFQHFRSIPGRVDSLSSNQVGPLLEDRHGRLWIGTTGGGLNRCDNPGASPQAARFRFFTTRNGLANDVVNGILEDSEGALWISTDHGLSRFDPEGETFRNFDIHDGLQDNSFNFGAYFQSPGGELFFGGHQGVNAFMPSQIQDNPHIPPVVITRFKKFNREVILEKYIAVMDALELSYQDSVFSFELAVLDYTNPQKNQLAYRLEGFDKDWVSLGSKREVTYTNLDPGSYVFRARGSNNDGVWNEEGLALHLRIVPPPWQTPWAYALYAVLLMAAVFLYQQRQTRKWRLERLVVASLRRNDRLKDEFLANTSHELRTPLNGIIGIVESLIDGVTGSLPPKTVDNLGMVAASARRLANLVNDLLDFSHLRNQTLQLNIKAVNLYGLAEVVLALTKPLAGQKDVVFHNQISPELPAVAADEDRLQQILHNLVGNALKFTERGEVRLDAKVREKRMVINVSDTGIGIEPEQGDQIFQAFQQGDGSISRLYGGTGLGLAITKSLVELHGGEIDFESQPNLGTTFSFSLPLAGPELADAPIKKVRLPTPTIQRVATVPAKEAPTRPDSPSASTLKSPRILVVDDDPVNLQVMINHLSLMPAEVEVAAGGEEALTRLGEAPGFDLLILDVMMPRMSGYELCRHIRQTHSSSHLPIILLTAKTRVADLVEGFHAGASDYLAKPVSKSELLSRIQTHLKLLETSRELRFSKKKLEEYSRTLEHRVEERTQVLAEKHRELSTFEKILRVINREVGLEDLLFRVLEQSRVLFPKAEKGVLLITDAASAERKTFRVAAVLGYESEELKGKTIEAGELLANFAGESERVKPGIYRVFPPKRGGARIPGFRDPLSRIVMDIRIENRLEGFLVLDNDREVRAFAKEDFQKMERLREHVLSAIMKSRLLEALKEKNEKITQTQNQLLETAHHAGMAEIAANMLHNVGNVLSSVKTSVNLILTDMEKSQIFPFYAKLVTLIEENRENLGPFFSADPRAEKVPDALSRVKKESAKFLEHLKMEVLRLNKNISYIDNIVASQREYTDAAGLYEEVDLNAAVKGVLQTQRFNLQESQIEIVKDFGDIPKIKLSKSKVMKVLAHLINNAREALEDWPQKKKIILRTRANGSSAVKVEIIDSGPGIRPENLPRLFTQGFSTKAGRPGFGLHYCANAMAEMEGHIGVTSEGPNRGTVFTLDFKPISDSGTAS